MEDKLYLFKNQPQPLWNETKNNSTIKNIISPFYIQQSNPTNQTIDLPLSISKFYVTLIGGGGSGSLGEHRILHNSLEEGDQSYPDTGYKNVIPLAGSGGGGGATIFRMPVVIRQKQRKTRITFEVGAGGEGREIRFGNRVDPSGVSLNYPETQVMKDFRKGRRGGDSKMIVSQFDLDNHLIKEFKIKAMGGSGGGVVGYFITRSQIMNMDSNDFNYIWDWSAAIESDEQSNEYVNIPGYTDPPYLYWNVRKSDDVSSNEYKELSHISIAAENYLQITRIPSYVIVAFHRELYYPIQDPGFRNDYIAYNLLTHSESGITKFDYYKPNDTITLGTEQGYFSQSNLNESDFGDFSYTFDYNVSSNTSMKNFCFLAQYNPYRIGVDDRSSIGITRSKSDQLFGHPRYYLRTGFTYNYKDRTVNLFRNDLSMPYNYPLKEKLALTTPEIDSLILNRWSNQFQRLMNKDLPGPLYEKQMIKGEQGAFGGAGGSFLLYDDLVPSYFDGLYGGKGIKSRWNQLISGSGGRPYPRNIWDIVDMNELNRLKSYENAYFYYGGKGYSSTDANSSGSDTFITNHLIAGSGGGTIDYINTNHYISSRKYNGPPVTFKDVDPLSSEGSNLKTYDGIFQWFKNNYETIGTGGKIKYQGWDLSNNPISKLYMNDKYGKHNISFTDNGSQIPIEELLYIFGGGGGGGKAFYFEPGSGQESPLIEPQPAGIGCGSGGSCSMNEDGKSAVRGIPPMNVNWYLSKMLNSPSECKLYTEFGDNVFVYTVTTLVSVMILNIALSILIDVFGGAIASAALSGLKIAAKAVGSGIVTALKLSKIGRSILNGAITVGAFFKKSSSFFKKIGGLFSKISSWVGRFGEEVYNSNKKLFDVLGTIFSVLTNDWSFLAKKSNKLFSLISEAEKIKDLIKNVEKLEETTEKINKLEKLNKRLAELTNILGNKINYAQLNPKKYKTLNWFFGTGVDDYFEKLGTKLDNYFDNYTKSISKITEKRAAEIKSMVQKLPDVESAVKDIEIFKNTVFKEVKNLSRPAEQLKFTEELQNIYKLKLNDEKFWSEIAVMKETSEFFTKSENMIGDAKNYFLRMNNDNLPKLTTKQQREILFDMSSRPLSSVNPTEDIKQITESIKKGPFTIDEQSELIHNLFINNQASFFKDGKELGLFKQIQEQFGKKFYYKQYFKNINPQFYLYLRESENVGQSIKKFNLMEKLSSDPDMILSINKDFRIDLFQSFDSPSTVNHADYCNKLINRIHENPRVVKHLLKNPSLLSKEPLGSLFEDIHASFLAKASSDPDNMELIIRNLDQFNIKPQKKIEFQAYNTDKQLVNFAIEDGKVYRYVPGQSDILFEYNGTISYLEDSTGNQLNKLTVSNGVIQNKNADLNHIRLRPGLNEARPEISIRIQKNQKEYIESLRKNIQKFIEENNSSFYRVASSYGDSMITLKGLKMTDEQVEKLDDIFFKYLDNPNETRIELAKKYMTGEGSVENKIAYYKLLNDYKNSLEELKSNLGVTSLPELNPPSTINFETDFIPKIGTDYVPNRMSKESIFEYYQNSNKKLSYSEVRKLDQAYNLKGDEGFIKLIDRTDPNINFLKELDLSTLTPENFSDRMMTYLATLDTPKLDKKLTLIEFVDYYESNYLYKENRIKRIFEDLFPDLKYKTLESSEIKNLIIRNRKEMEYAKSIVYNETLLENLPYQKVINDENKFSLSLDLPGDKKQKSDRITKLMAERNKRIQKKISCS